MADVLNYSPDSARKIISKSETIKFIDETKKNGRGRVRTCDLLCPSN